MTQTNKKGFTIIEVVLVLAIAGLIFAMVFIALPALQRNQRDTARRNDASTVSAAVNSYRSNNKSLAGMNSGKLQSYVDKLDQYEKTNIVVKPRATSDQTIGDNEIAVFPQTKCNGAADPGGRAKLTGGTSRQAAVVVRLENTGASDKFINHCVDV
ncbi:MAG: type II secretion system protein [Candidatus Saccharibacteria bacterium]|nr:type II secretion system protein [Candidatus Saccharibacteria bacterium]